MLLYCGFNSTTWGTTQAAGRKLNPVTQHKFVRSERVPYYDEKGTRDQADT